ncbi:cupin domain-containing protein [Phenylobacterium sp.]|jgi:quercetin dioxygenase-like cupin family protein|uniref:cupin domain-containing protein n=1 Tax=Phenylobacterium sp. TaxID=1871053 RepID=UPI002F935B5D
MSIPTRRIVTGVDAKGRSFVLSDGPTPNLFGPKGEPYLINFWATKSAPADYSDARDPADHEIPLHPFPSGATFRFFRVPPESAFAGQSDEERRARTAAYYAQVGAADAFVPEGRHPAFHRTNSVDFIVLLEGEVTLMLDDGDVAMKPFDVVVQRGSNHAWVNFGDSTALMLAVLVDGRQG